MCQTVGYPESYRNVSDEVIRKKRGEKTVGAYLQYAPTCQKYIFISFQIFVPGPPPGAPRAFSAARVISSSWSWLREKTRRWTTLAGMNL